MRNSPGLLFRLISHWLWLSGLRLYRSGKPNGNPSGNGCGEMALEVAAPAAVPTEAAVDRVQAMETDPP